jgi:hypothetical protein
MHRRSKQDHQHEQREACGWPFAKRGIGPPDQAAKRQPRMSEWPQGGEKSFREIDADNAISPSGL